MRHPTRMAQSALWRCLPAHATTSLAVKVSLQHVVRHCVLFVEFERFVLFEPVAALSDAAGCAGGTSCRSTRASAALPRVLASLRCPEAPLLNSTHLRCMVSTCFKCPMVCPPWNVVASLPGLLAGQRFTQCMHGEGCSTV